MENKFIRNELLLGEEVVKRLENLSILVVGCGGVGGYAIESLARLGVRYFTLVDNDVVDYSNYNRQIVACDDSVGKNKVDAYKERILNINKEAQVDCKAIVYNKENENLIFDKKYDFVVDAIDTLSLKWELIKTCINNKIKFISSMGMGNKLDLTKIEILTLDKTYNDPVSKKLREFARKDKVPLNKIPVVFSSELPYKQNKVVSVDSKVLKDRVPPSSIVFVPAAAGLLMGQYILAKTMNE